MHELSLAQDIVTQIHAEAAKRRCSRVLSARIEIGELSGVVSDSLEFCLPIVAQDEMFHETTWELRGVPVEVRCLSCQSITRPELPHLLCRACGSHETEIIAGQELLIREVEMD